MADRCSVGSSPFADTIRLSCSIVNELGLSWKLPEVEEVPFFEVMAQMPYAGLDIQLPCPWLWRLGFAPRPGW